MSRPRHIALAWCLLAVVTIGVAACSSERDAARKRISPEYDQAGKLQLLKYDSTGNGKVDTWSYMDGPRVLRIEIDQDGDGAIDRWEYYGPNQELLKVGVSKRHDGTEDRIEYFEHGGMVRAEEDTDADGRIDKWETFDGARLSSVAFDTAHHGLPDRRITYEIGGRVNLEVDQAGDGHLLPVRTAAATVPSSSK